MSDITVFQIIHHFFHCHLCTVVFRFFRRCSEMWNYNRPFYTCNLRCREICNIMLYFTGNKCIYHCFGIHQHISCKVQNDHTFLHKAQGIFSDHSLCAVKCRHVNGNVITVFIDFIYICCMVDTSGKSPCRINRHIWIVSIYIHAQMCCGIRHKHTDCSQADNSKFLSLQFLSRKCLLRLFGIFGYVSILFIFLHPVDAANDISGCQKHTGNHQFFYSICISSRCIKYNNSLFRTFLKRDIIHTCTGSCDRFQI